MNEVNGNDNLGMTQQDYDDLSLLGVNDTEEPQLFKGQKVVRWVVVGFSGMSSASIVNAVIKNNVHPTNKFGKLQLAVGAACIGGLVSAAVQQNVGDGFDGLITSIRNAITEEV